MKNKCLELVHPRNFRLTKEERIEHLKIAILVLKDHMQKFGREIKKENPTAYKFITDEIINLERELKIRMDFLIPEVLKLALFAPKLELSYFGST